MRRTTIASLMIATALCLTVGGDQTGEAGTGTALKPIIAELYATPQDFAGRVVAVYGVVVESSPTGAEFLLQDVSQRPLKVIGSARLTATVGDQVTIIGRFNSDSRSPYLTALVLAPTRVLGGGGCC